MRRIEFGPAGRAVAANVRRLRIARGMSLRGLAEALEAEGRHLGQDALGKIENGAQGCGGGARNVRRVDVDDLAALAVVLDVSPWVLLLPPGPKQPAQGAQAEEARRDG